MRVGIEVMPPAMLLYKAALSADLQVALADLHSPNRAAALFGNWRGARNPVTYYL